MSSISSKGFLQVLRNAQFLKHPCCKHLSTSSTRGSEKVYEFRTYTALPSKMRDAMKIMEDNILPYRQKFSKMSGCWVTELGGMNEMNFLWEFGKPKVWCSYTEEPLLTAF